MLKIAISGATGKMGLMLQQVVKDNPATTIGALINKDNDLVKFIDKFDILIDFSRPEASQEYMAICAKYHKKIVIGTTGFSDDEILILKQFSQQIAIVFSPNMSIGVNLMFKLLEKTAATIGNESDIEIIETHHRHKVDAPSGTAIKMGEVIATTLNRNLTTDAVYSRKGTNQRRSSNTIGFATIRGGDVVGEHTTYFLSDGERIEITHKASSRIIFAKGAVKSALWLNSKKNGLYSMQDVLGF